MLVLAVASGRSRSSLTTIRYYCKLVHLCLNDSNNAQAGDFYSVGGPFRDREASRRQLDGSADEDQFAPMSRVAVKRELLRWARERPGLEAADLVECFPKYEAWESGDEQPTFR